MNKSSLTICLIVLLFSKASFGEVVLPTGLSSSDQEKILKIFGFGTASKTIGTPYSLGGYQGLDISLNFESFDLVDVGNLGNGADTQSTLSYPTFSIGKGLYNKFDLFLHFVPFLERTGISEFGAVLRWGVYQPTDLPFSLAFSIHGNSSNISDRLVSSSIGARGVATFNFYDFSVFSSLGRTFVNGRFVEPGSTGTETIELSENLFAFGAAYHFEPVLASFQIERHTFSTFVIKLGIRY